MENSILVLDIETETFGRPNPDKDIMKVFGCYSYIKNKSYVLTRKDDIQKIINIHKYIVTFNGDYYDIPIMKRMGYNFDYKVMIDLKKCIKSRSRVIKTKNGMLEDLLLEYSLDYITKALGIVDEDSGKGKIDFSVFKKNEWTPDEIADIRKYLLRDIEVTKKLYEWCENYFSMFKDFILDKDVILKRYLTSTPATIAYKVICKAMKWEEKYDFSKESDFKIGGGYTSYPAGESYEGDYVLKDFTSLYPHIIIKCNLQGRKKGNDDRPVFPKDGQWKTKGQYYSDKMSGVGIVMKKLYAMRKKFKDDGDMRELAIKIILNSMYGIMDNPIFVNTYDPIAADDCTRIGRQWIKYARKVFKDNGYEVCYSDSVGKDTMLRTNYGDISIEELFDIGEKDKVIEKEVSILDDCKILSMDNNYNVVLDKVKKVIRHKTNKIVYRLILNNYENIVVTEDHSLIWFDDNGKLVSIKPVDASYVIRPDKVEKIKKIEKIEYDDYVYDVETQNTKRFFGNDILLHNTDSIFFGDKFNDKERIEKVTKSIIDHIKSTVPFPQDTFGLETEDEISHLFFFKGKGTTSSSDNYMDDMDYINKPKGFLKKNYIYINKKGDVKFKNLGVKKKSSPMLSRKIFRDDIIPLIKKHKEVKFSRKMFNDLIRKYLEQDMSLAAIRYNVGNPEDYEKSKTGIYSQIAERYGQGVHFLIPNNKMIGVGKSKDKRMCSIEEFKSHNMTIDDIDTSSILSSLDYFIKSVTTKNIFDFGGKFE